MFSFSAHEPLELIDSCDSSHLIPVTAVKQLLLQSISQMGQMGQMGHAACIACPDPHWGLSLLAPGPKF